MIGAVVPYELRPDGLIMREFLPKPINLGSFDEIAVPF